MHRSFHHHGWTGFVSFQVVTSPTQFVNASKFSLIVWPTPECRSAQANPCFSIRILHPVQDFIGFFFVLIQDSGQNKMFALTEHFGFCPGYWRNHDNVFLHLNRSERNSYTTVFRGPWANALSPQMDGWISCAVTNQRYFRLLRWRA